MLILYLFVLGHYCLQGSIEPLRCISGEYQDEIGQSECKDCPQGYFCDNVYEPVVLYNDSYCPTGKIWLEASPMTTICSFVKQIVVANNV